jgi:hypothetical protein
MAQRGSNRAAIRKRAEDKIASRNGARPARIDYTCPRTVNRFELPM